jgi:hypothetical protein
VYVETTLGLYEPAAQAGQIELPAEEVNWPGGQMVHNEDPVPLWKNPIEHFKQLADIVRPVDREYKPAGQPTQLSEET